MIIVKISFSVLQMFTRGCCTRESQSRAPESPDFGREVLPTMISALRGRGLRTIFNSSSRCYISRAHPPESVPTYTIHEALTTILEGVEGRKVKRAERWEKNKEKRVAKGIQVRIKQIFFIR